MQIDVDPQEDPQNAPDVNYVVENPTLVRSPAGERASQSSWVSRTESHCNLLSRQIDAFQRLFLSLNWDPPEFCHPLMSGSQPSLTSCTHFSPIWSSPDFSLIPRAGVLGADLLTCRWLLSLV